MSQDSNHRLGFAEFLRHVRRELTKVTWPTGREAVIYTVVVLVMVSVSGLFVFGLDRLFSKLVVGLFGD